MYKCGERHQIGLFPASIEDYIGPNDPVRIYDAFVEAIDFNTLGIPIAPNKDGAHEYHPKPMLKLLLYGYSYGGTRSSRKLERACHHNLSFIWLMGGLKPDYRTIARFRRENKDAIKKVLKESVRLCLEAGLIDGNILFVDGSPIRANASIDNTWTAEKVEKYLKQAEATIDKLMTEAEEIDREEEWQDSLVNIKAELRDSEKLKQKIEEIAQRLKASGREHINSVDPESVNVKGRQGTHASYHGELVVDEKHGLIVQSEAVSQSNDFRQFRRQMEQAGENIGYPPEQGCADAGFYSLTDLAQVTRIAILVMPNIKQAQADNQRHPLKPMGKEEFKYEAKADEYTCPEGKRLKYRGNPFGDERRRLYQAEGRDCRACPQFGKCTKRRDGRKIIRMKEEHLKEQLAQIYESADGQVVYKLRKQKAELPFGHIKRNLGCGQFLLRGKSGADAELSILGSCFNIARMITIIGIPGLIAKLING